MFGAHAHQCGGDGEVVEGGGVVLVARAVVSRVGGAGVGAVEDSVESDVVLVPLGAKVKGVCVCMSVCVYYRHALMNAYINSRNDMHITQ